MDFHYIELDEVYAIHERMIEIGGGREGIQDFTLLHSSLERPKVTFGGNMLYPTIWLQAAALMHSLIKNHPFNDGNKRTGFFSTIRFLKLNGYQFSAEQEEVVQFALSVDTENLKLDVIASLLREHSQEVRKE